MSCRSARRMSRASTLAPRQLAIRPPIGSNPNAIRNGARSALLFGEKVLAQRVEAGVEHPRHPSRQRRGGRVLTQKKFAISGD